MCHHVVGTEETVKTRRMLNAINDNLDHNKVFKYITSGSCGEGLEMKGSDIDIMLVQKECHACKEKLEKQCSFCR